MSDPQLIRARVVGTTPVRDYLTKESIGEGGVVRLLPRQPNEARPALGSVLIDALVSAGAIEVLAGPETKAKS